MIPIHWICARRGRCADPDGIAHGGDRARRHLGPRQGGAVTPVWAVAGGDALACALVVLVVVLLVRRG